ncbi:tetratricopeptide repeat protein [Paenibacillus sp. y28]|uniref:tetratricopeptide repeat protein n=1 Tax=Paenibacillus sp. y28 TaxID=3129110 RepID=UPI003019D3C0
MTDLAEAHYRLACICRKIEDFEHAISHLQQALEFGYSEYWVRFQRSLVYMDLGQLERANQDAHHCLALLPYGDHHEELQRHLLAVHSKLELEN